MSSRPVLVVALILLPGPAWGAAWGIGTHLGVGTIRSGAPYTGSSTSIAWPASAFTYQPGLRLALSDDSRTNEMQLDSGLFYLDQAGSFLSLLVVSAGYQRTFLPARRTAPFVTASVGLLREGGAALTSSTLGLGAGVGLRKIVRERHGDVRAELRVDRLESDSSFGRPRLTTVGLRLGFDLWM